jgi:hypothetical protein
MHISKHCTFYRDLIANFILDNYHSKLNFIHNIIIEKIISNGSNVKTIANNRYQQQFFILESLLILFKSEFQVPSYSKITYNIIHIHNSVTYKNIQL